MGWINLCFLWCFATWQNIRLISGMPREKASRRAQELLPPWLPPAYPPWAQNVFCLIKDRLEKYICSAWKISLIILYSGANIFLSELLRFLHQLYHSQDPGTNVIAGLFLGRVVLLQSPSRCDGLKQSLPGETSGCVVDKSLCDFQTGNVSGFWSEYKS